MWTALILRKTRRKQGVAYTQKCKATHLAWEVTLDFVYDLNALIESGEWRWTLTIIYLSSEEKISVGGLSGLPKWAGF